MNLHWTTTRFIALCFNIVVRAFVIAVSWGCLLLIGVGLNWLIDLSLRLLGASETVENILSQIVLVYVLVLGVAATLTGTKDVWSLTIAGLRNSSTTAQSDEGEDHHEVKQGNSSG